MTGSRVAGPEARLLDVFGFQVRLDFAMQARCSGGFFGLLVRNRTLRRRENAKQGALIA
jgi:hypothetical protein